LENGDYRLVGRTDGLLRIGGKLWLREVKSYGSKGRLNYAHVDPQLVVYTALAEAVYGEPIFGVLYDGIYTYQWKRDVHPAADSFERRYFDISPTMRENGAQYLAAALRRRQHLIAWPGDALPSIGQMCNSCGFKAKCWSQLGDDELEIGDVEVLDDGEPV
jgi:hypothetical protein